MIFKPSIFDAKYDKMTYEERSVAFDRDRMLYEQTIALQELANATKNNQPNIVETNTPDYELQANRIIFDAEHSTDNSIEDREITILANAVEYWTKVKDNTITLILFYVSLTALAGMAMLFTRYDFTKYIVIVAGLFLTTLYTISKIKVRNLYNKIIQIKNRE